VTSGSQLGLLVTPALVILICWTALKRSGSDNAGRPSHWSK